MKIGKTHLIIPDTQAKAGVPDDHLRWIGQYIVDRKPDVVIHLGDHWDMPALSGYDKGKKQFEGRRYKSDIKAGNEALKLITDPLHEYNLTADIIYQPRLVLLRGNHEDRINKALADDPYLEGVIGYHDFENPGWETSDYHEVLFIDGIGYSHAFENPMTGKPWGGVCSTRIKNIGHTFTMGHQQTLDYTIRFVAGKSQHGLVAGACYLHDEEYKGPQGNSHWRGLIVKNSVHEGQYNPMFVDLDYLCQKYEGVTLNKYIENNLIPPEEPFAPWKRKRQTKTNRPSVEEIKEMKDLFEEDYDI